MKAAEEEEAAQVKWTLHPVYGLPSLMRKKRDAFYLIDRSPFVGQTFALFWGELQTFFILKNK